MLNSVQAGTAYPERDIVLVGGGHTHALVLRKWGMAPFPRVRLTLVNPGPFAPYSGMLPGYIAGHYTRAEMEMDLVPLARFAGARLIVDDVVAIDPVARSVRLRNRAPIAYDLLSLNVGINAQMPEIPGFAEHGVAVKPFGAFVAAWEVALEQMTAGNRPPEIAVVGGGVAGVELALALHHRLASAGLSPAVTVIEREVQILAAAAPRTRRILTTAMNDRGISVETAAMVKRITRDAVCLADGRRVLSAFTLTAAGARPQPWLASSPLASADGYVEVGADLRATRHPDVFAAGDCAHMTGDPRPKAGVFAVRQAPVLFDNLRAAISGAPLRPYRAQRRFLKLVSVGGKDAIAERGSLVLGHPRLWHLKDRIDRRFMNLFADLPGMAAAGELAPLCGGCGSKVGGGELARALGALPPSRNPNVLSRPGDDAAILDRNGLREIITTDHLRTFTADPALMARIAAVHALGDIWAMGAKPDTVLVSLILERVHPRLQRRTLLEVMAAIADVVADAGAEIVGGHTSEGAELTVGLTATGLADRPVAHAGALPGDALILTKPIGTGTVLAAEMAGRARGDWVLAAYRSMARPLAAASRLLGPVARAMTDVTGFGLAGHLDAMMRQSGTRARLSLDSVPFLPGAVALAETGIRSSLYPANRADHPLDGPQDGARAHLLHDPQTAGGLLAAVPAERAGDVLASLREAGEDAARIGEVIEGGDGPAVIVPA